MKCFATILFSFLFSAMSLAQEVAPDVLVRTVTEEVLEVVRADKDIKSGNTGKVVDLVEARVLPHFNFARMTQLAVGRDWRQASPAQQKALTDEFRELLVRTYSKALTEYKNQTIVYKPFTMKAGETDVKVRTEVRQSSGGKPIELDYSLEKTGAAWKVYDIEVAKASLVTAYRDSFSTAIRNNGIDELIKSLQAKNKTGDSAAAKK